MKDVGLGYIFDHSMYLFIHAMIVLLPEGKGFVWSRRSDGCKHFDAY